MSASDSDEPEPPYVTAEQALGPLPPRSADADKARRRVLPLSSGGGYVLDGGPPAPPLPPNVHAVISATMDAGQTPLQPDRLYISPGTGPWAIHAIVIDDVVQPVELFSSFAGPGWDLSRLSVCTKTFALEVSYIGDKPEGDHLLASVVGR